MIFQGDIAPLWSNNSEVSLSVAASIYGAHTSAEATRDRLSRALVRCVHTDPNTSCSTESLGKLSAHVALGLFSAPPSRSPETDVAAAFALQRDFPHERWCQSVITGYQALQRGDWVTRLSIAQKRGITSTLSQSIRLLEPSQLAEFWRVFDRDEAEGTSPLASGVRALLTGHSVQHLISGLQICRTPQAMNVILLALEQLADPQSLPLLHILEPTLAAENWPLARLVGRAIRVIYQQNPDIVRSDLLVPSASPLRDHHLVRTVAKVNDTQTAHGTSEVPGTPKQPDGSH